MPRAEATSSLVYDWLFDVQISPAFLKHDYLQRAIVLAIPAIWAAEPNGSPPAPIRMMIFYSQDERIRLDDVVSAYTLGSQDPNLPVGVGNHDLFEPVGVIGSTHAAKPTPIEMCPASFFAGGEMDVENDDGGVLSAFFVYARFRRTADGVVCEHRDDRMGERMDRFLAAVMG